MLPSLIFGGLISSGSDTGRPVLNDNAAITENVNEIAFAVSEALGAGITDAEARIAEDFAGTDGDQYEIIIPYSADMAGNTNRFIAQYCSAREEAREVISLSDTQKALAEDYAQNLSLFLGDGMFQYTEFNGSSIPSLGDVRFTDGVTEVVYFN